MKRRVILTFAAATAMVALALTGCGKKDEISMRANVICEAYVHKMDSGETTPEQDQAFIRAVRDVVFELDRNIRGKDKAQATREHARQATMGEDPNAPFKLFDEKRDAPEGDLEE